VLRWSAPEDGAIDITKKLADRADAFVTRHKTQEPVLQRLFCVRLAHVPAQGAPTRQRAFLDDLSPEERELVAELAAPEQRILVTGQSEGRAIAEVAHEKLFTAWRTLRTWIGSRRGFFAWATQIDAWRKDWEKGGRQTKDLLIGRPLKLARSYLLTDGTDVPKADAAFIDESLQADHRQKAQEEELERKAREAEILAERLARESAEQQARASRRITQRTIAGLAAALFLAAIAIWFWIDAAKTRDEALLSQSKSLSDFSEQATDRGNAGLGLLLALEALPDATSENATTAGRP
jgi:hypothetical protein